MTDPRKPLWTCPHCGEQRFSVMGCFGISQHMEEAHGIICRRPMEPRGRYWLRKLGLPKAVYQPVGQWLRVRNERRWRRKHKTPNQLA